MEGQIHHLPFANLPTTDRGDGIISSVIATTKQGAKNIRTGITRIRVGGVVPMHAHNCEEQITVLEGKLRMTIADKVFDCGPYDSSYISSEVPHEFTNIGDKPVLLLFIYGSSYVTRTFISTGETVDHVSGRDTVPPPDPKTKAVKA